MAPDKVLRAPATSATSMTSGMAAGTEIPKTTETTRITSATRRAKPAPESRDWPRSRPAATGTARRVCRKAIPGRGHPEQRQERGAARAIPGPSIPFERQAINGHKKRTADCQRGDKRAEQAPGLVQQRRAVVVSQRSRKHEERSDTESVRVSRKVENRPPRAAQVCKDCPYLHVWNAQGGSGHLGRLPNLGAWRGQMSLFRIAFINRTEPLRSEAAGPLYG